MAKSDAPQESATLRPGADNLVSDVHLAGSIKRILRGAIRALEGSAGAVLLPADPHVRQPVARAPARPPDTQPITELFLTIGLRSRARQALLLALHRALPMAQVSAGEASGPPFSLSTSAVAETLHGLPDAPLLDRFVMVPVVGEGGLLGIIAVLRPSRAFTDVEQRVIDAYAGQVAIAIENATLTRALDAQRARAESVIAQSPDGIVVMDAERRIITFNPAMELLTGHRRADAVGHLYTDVLALFERTASRDLAPLLDLELLLDMPLPGAAPVGQSEGGTATHRAHLDAVLVARDGRRANVSLTVTMNVDTHGTASGATINVRDTTGAHQIEQLRSAFLSMTSHELQTPVAIIKAYAETLRRRYSSFSDEVLHESLVAIDEECDRLARLVANLLRVSRIEAGALELRKSQVDLVALCARVVRRIAPRAGPTFQIRSALSPGFPPVLADQTRIEEVLTNLVENAVKYSTHGGTITIEGKYPAAPGVDEVEIAVHDEGPGIPLRELERLFDRFYRTSSAAGSNTTGAGLGLYLCRAIIRAHSGDLRVESIWGAGSTFSFTLPRNGSGQRTALPLERMLALDAPGGEPGHAANPE